MTQRTGERNGVGVGSLPTMDLQPLPLSNPYDLQIGSARVDGQLFFGAIMVRSARMRSWVQQESNGYHLASHPIARIIVVSGGRYGHMRMIDQSLQSPELSGTLEGIQQGKHLPHNRQDGQDRSPFYEEAFAIGELSMSAAIGQLTYELETAAVQGGAVLVYNVEGRQRTIVYNNVASDKKAADRKGRTISIYPGETVLFLSNYLMDDQQDHEVERLMLAGLPIDQLQQQLQIYCTQQMDGLGLSEQGLAVLRLPSAEQTMHDIYHNGANQNGHRRKS